MKTVRIIVALVAIVLLAPHGVLQCEAQALPVHLSIRSQGPEFPVTLCWNTTTNAWYQVEYCSGLTTTQWRPAFFSPFRGTGGVICITDAVSVGQGQRFYRVTSRSAFGPGYLAFSNLGAGVNSPFSDCNGVRLSGSGYSVEMLVGVDQNFVTNSVVPLFTGNFSPPGYFNGGPRFVPAAAIDPTGKTWVIIRAWWNAGGTIMSYAQATSSGVPNGLTAPFQATPQQSDQIPANPLSGMPLINGTGVICIF